MRRWLGSFGSFACGLLFALGLGIGGMTRPEKVVGFLDVAGEWDPTLAFVMAGALAVALPAFPLVLRRPAPLAEARFAVPAGHRPIDRRLLLGATVFGIGWGMAGYCPGPAIVGLVTGQSWVFVVFMALGLFLGKYGRAR